MYTPSPHTGITIALTGRDEVTAWRQLVEPLGRGVLPGPLVAQRNISVTTVTALHDDHCFPLTAPSERSAVHPKLGAAAMGGPIFFRENRH
jgi:hypothetical protein